MSSSRSTESLCRILLACLLALSPEALPVVAAGDCNKITGHWSSNYGPVQIHAVAAGQAAGCARVAGQWLEAPGHKGIIESGYYDARTRMLNLVFLETWSGHRGTVKLKLSADGKSMSGVWKGNDGSSGTWSWKR